MCVLPVYVFFNADIYFVSVGIFECWCIFLNVVSVFFEAGVYFECAFYSSLMCILREYVFLKTAVCFVDVPVFHHWCVFFL